ncbi:MAG: vitamin K epoxide reductase family protein [Aureliella sp.]
MSTNHIIASHASNFSMQHAGSRTIARNVQPSLETLPYSGIQWILRLIALIALTTSSYLAWVAFNSGSVAGCGSGSTFDCSHVLSSRWSSLLGIPVSVPAVLLYALVSVILVVPANWRWAQWRWSLVAFAAFLAGFGGLWFIGLQIFWLKHLCPYCLVVHGCGLAMASLIATHRLTQRYVTVRLVITAAITVLCFVAAQIFLPAAEKFEIVEYESVPSAEVYAPPGEGSSLDQPIEVSPAIEQGDVFESPLQTPKTGDSAQFNPADSSWLYGFNPMLLLTAQVAVGRPSASRELETESAGEDRKLVTILNGVQLDIAQWPLLGNADAKYVIVEMLDYTCVHCQNTHAAIHGAMQAYGDQLAVVVLPVPLDATCNSQINTTAAEHREACKIAKLAIAVWHLSPQHFTEFHNWLMESKPNYAQASLKAESLVDREKLQSELRSSTPSDFIKKNVDLYKRASAGAIPKILFPRTSAVGEMRSKDTLISLIERELVQKPK